MINLILDRKYIKEEYTIGTLYINGDYFCDTLEDKVRDLNKDGDLDDIGEEKVPKLTAIPYGRYKIEISMSPKFNRKLPLLLKVPHFTGIRIHAGNTASDSDGCILVGENKQKGKLINSRFWENKLTILLQMYQRVGNEIYINIV